MSHSAHSNEVGYYGNLLTWKSKYFSTDYLVLCNYSYQYKLVAFTEVWVTILFIIQADLNIAGVFIVPVLLQISSPPILFYRLFEMVWF